LIAAKPDDRSSAKSGAGRRDGEPALPSIAPLLILAVLGGASAPLPPTGADAPRLAYADLAATDNSLAGGPAPRLDYALGTANIAGPIRSEPARLIQSAATTPAAPPPLPARSDAGAEQRLAGFVRAEAATPAGRPPARAYRAAPPPPLIPTRL
jgi:hypothetical protein